MTSSDLTKLQAYNTLIQRLVANGREVGDVPQQLQHVVSEEQALTGRSFSDLSVDEFQKVLSRIDLEEQLVVARQVMNERREVLRKLAE